MDYKFICPKCGKQKEIQMKISEYTNKGHYCECGEELKRCVKDLGTTFDTSKISGFCGKCGS
jgi:predicted nucleic acid-binding Zn ribbon protein